MSYMGVVRPTIALTSSDIADDAVITAKINDDAVTAAKIANSINTDISANTAKVTNATHTGDVTGATALTIATDAVDIAMLSATGTASSSTFLRGDNAWAAAGGGKILQVVVGYLDGTASTTSTTFADSGLDADITPAATTSRIWIQATLVSAYNNAVNVQGTFRLMRDDTTNLTPYGNDDSQEHIGVVYGNDSKINSTVNFTFVDSPSTTSSTNYSVWFAVNSGGDQRINQNGQRSYIHLIEIGA